jgi:hypothetical protein
MVDIGVASALGKRTTDVEGSRDLLAWVSRERTSPHLMTVLGRSVVSTGSWGARRHGSPSPSEGEP